MFRLGVKKGTFGVLIVFTMSGCGMESYPTDVASSTGTGRSGSASLAIDSTLPWPVSYTETTQYEGKGKPSYCSAVWCHKDELIQRWLIRAVTGFCKLHHKRQMVVPGCRGFTLVQPNFILQRRKTINVNLYISVNLYLEYLYEA